MTAPWNYGVWDFNKQALMGVLLAGMALGSVLVGTTGLLYVSKLNAEHAADKKAAVHFATLGHAEDLEFHRLAMVGCMYFNDKCLSALGRDSSEGDTAIELEPM